MSTVTPPAVNTWDVDGILADALTVLRLDPNDADADRVAGACVEATEQLDQDLDATTAIDTELVRTLHQSAVDLAVSLYRRKDAPLGVSSSYSPDEFIAVEADPLAAARRRVLPYKQRWGIA